MRLPNGIGTVTKLKGKRNRPWWARGPEQMDDAGKFHRQSLGTFKRRSDAVEALKQRDKELKPTNLTLEKIYALYIEDRVKKEALEESTIKGYNDSFKHCKPLENKVFTSITLPEWEQLFDTMYKLNAKGQEPLSRTTKKKVKAVVTNLYTFAIRKEYAKKNLGEQIELIKTDQTTEKEIFTEDQIQIMFEKVNDIPDLDIILIFIHTGLRPSELLKIKKENVDIENQCLINFGIKTIKSKKRVMPIAEKIFPYLQKRYEETEDYLFKNSEGRPLTPSVYRRSRFNPALKELGLEKMNITPNSTRHTFASLLNKNNVRGSVTADLMGHESEKTTLKNYNHEHIEELRKAVNTL